MSDNIEPTSRMANPITELFKLSWNAGCILFGEKNNSTILENAFQLAEKLCDTENAIVRMTLNANRLLFDRIVERNDQKAGISLSSLGDDLVELIKLHQ